MKICKDNLYPHLYQIITQFWNLILEPPSHQVFSLSNYDFICFPGNRHLTSQNFIETPRILDIQKSQHSCYGNWICRFHTGTKSWVHMPCGPMLRRKLKLYPPVLGTGVGPGWGTKGHAVLLCRTVTQMQEENGPTKAGHCVWGWSATVTPEEHMKFIIAFQAFLFLSESLQAAMLLLVFS